MTAGRISVTFTAGGREGVAELPVGDIVSFVIPDRFHMIWTQGRIAQLFGEDVRRIAIQQIDIRPTVRAEH